MSAETKATIKFPGFAYSGFDVPALEMSESLIEGLGTNKKAYELATDSMPLVWRVALYTVGRDLAWGVDVNLPQPVKDAATLVYADAQGRKGRGGWHKDGILYLSRDQAPKGMRQPEDKDYVLAKYFIDIGGFEQKDDKWKIKTSPTTREEFVWLPKGGGAYAVPTCDGVYNHLTGTPIETIEDSEKAIKRWMETGLTEEQALKELSRNYRKDSGIAVVGSWSDACSGPLCVDLDSGPWRRDTLIGSFSRVGLPSGARRRRTQDT